MQRWEGRLGLQAWFMAIFVWLNTALQPLKQCIRPPTVRLWDLYELAVRPSYTAMAHSPSIKLCQDIGVSEIKEIRETQASTYHGLKTREIQLSNLESP